MTGGAASRWPVLVAVQRELRMTVTAEAVKSCFAGAHEIGSRASVAFDAGGSAGVVHVVVMAHYAAH